MENKAPQLRAIFFYATLLFGFLTMSYVNFQLSNFFNADIGGILLRLRVGVFLLPVFSMLVYFGTLIWKLQHKIWLFLQFFLLCLTVCLCVFLIAYPRVGGIPSPYQILSNSLISIWSLIGFSQCSKQIILFQNPPIDDLPTNDVSFSPVCDVSLWKQQHKSSAIFFFLSAGLAWCCNLFSSPPSFYYPISGFDSWNWYFVFSIVSFSFDIHDHKIGKK